MKNLKLRKLVAVALAVMTIATVSPIGASAAWKQDSNGWWNTEGSSWSTGWSNIDGAWYNFGSDGYMKTGWANDNGSWYYLNPASDGTKGAMKTGWVNDNGTWYYLNSVSDGTQGAMKTGWVNDNGTWYFTSASGAMQTGVVEVNGKIYYLAASGAMETGNVTINGVVYTFAATGEAIGDKLPTPTLAFNTNGASVVLNPTGDKTSTSGGGGGSNHSSGGGSTPSVDPNDITSTLSTIYADKLASVLKNHPTLAKDVSVTLGNPIAVTLLNTNLKSLEDAFNTAQNEDLSVIEARLAKAEEMMNVNSAMLNVDGVTFKEYLKKADDNYLANGGNSNYFKADGSFDTTAIAEKINNNTLTYDVFKTNLEARIIAMCDETKKAPVVTISNGTTNIAVTKIQKDGTTIYDTSLSRDTNIKGLVSLGNTTVGTYKIYSGNLYFTVKIS